DPEALERLDHALTDRYRIEREIGSGGLAVVYLAEDVRHGRQVALKVLRPDVASALGAERFLREIRIAARLTHPNILPLFDSGRTDDPMVPLLFYTMPYVTGESLRDRLRREKQLPLDVALGIAREVGEALGHAHAQGVLHRDIKPGNVLFQAGHALVADFGIARAVSAAGGERLTETGLVMGTPAYMSPEQAAGDREIGKRSDIYALATVLYEMLAGEPPFHASTAQAMLARKLVEPAPNVAAARATVPRHVEAAITRGLERLPGNRFSTVEEFVAALRAPEGASEADRPALAVLPFSNLSADPENEYFSDGVTEEIINAVAQIRDLRVTARTSAFQFKGVDDDVRDIGRRLGVGVVLEGSVRKAGNRVRVTAQLIDVAGGFHLWSERFDRDLEDIFAVQDEIAAAIARRLESEVAPVAQEASRTTEGPDPAAYDAYLRGRYHRRQMFSGGDATERSLAGYREAIAIDPGFAPAHGALAELNVVRSIGFAVGPSRELMAEAKEASERALALDPNLAEAHLARALVAMYDEWDHVAAKAGIDRAIAINPSFVDAHFWAEFYYTYVERDAEQAVAANRRAAELDPLDLNILSRLTQVHIIFGRLDEAIERLEGILRMDPQHMVSYLELADAHARRGDADKALAAAERGLELSGGQSIAAFGMAIAVASAGAGDHDRARELLGELTARAEREYVSPFWLAAGHAALGEMDRGFEYLAQAVRDHDPNLLYITATPEEMAWKDDPRYEGVLRDIGLGHLIDSGRS
ncbi:MAG: protein kinase, partial [Gemmatimonadota bacterium]